MGRILLAATVLLFTLALAALACTGSPAPTPAPPPTPTPHPTNTPAPTPTPYPTYTPAPTYTPYPTPTFTPLPTYTPRPTFTPRPTYAAPTPTPSPASKLSDDELVSNIITCLEQNDDAWADLLEEWAGGITEEYRPEDFRMLLRLIVASDAVSRSEVLELVPGCEQLATVAGSDDMPDPSVPPPESQVPPQNLEDTPNSDNASAPTKVPDDELVANVIDCLEQNQDVWADFKQGIAESLGGAGVAVVLADVAPEEFQLILKFAISSDPTARSALQDMLSSECGQPETTPTPKAIGKYFKGHTLHVSIADLARSDELRWTASYRNDLDEPLYKLETASDENELVLLRVKVENHTADSVTINIDDRSAEVHDALQGRYSPIDVGERAVPADATGDPSYRCNIPVNPDSPIDCVKFLWNTSHETITPSGTVKIVQRAQVLLKGTGLDGWMVFEVPKGTNLCSFRWFASDTITIDLEVSACSAEGVTPLRTS